MCLTYSTIGLRPDTDFLLWRIASGPDAFQEQARAINKTRLGRYLSTPHSLVSMTKRSMYIDKLDPFHTTESRTHIIPGKRKYLFVYPFVKTPTGICCHRNSVRKSWTSTSGSATNTPASS